MRPMYFAKMVLVAPNWADMQSCSPYAAYDALCHTSYNAIDISFFHCSELSVLRVHQVCSTILGLLLHPNFRR